MFRKLLQKLKSFTDKNDISKSYLGEEKFSSLEKITGFKISNTDFFVKALTHRSYLEISPELEKSNERLEFLGDSVLGLVVAESLFKNFLRTMKDFLRSLVLIW